MIKLFLSLALFVVVITGQAQNIIPVDSVGNGVAIFRTSRDVDNSICKVYLKQYKGRSYNTVAAMKYDLGEKNEQILDYRSTNAWGMIDDSIIYRFYPSSLKKEPRDAKKWILYEVHHIGFEIVFYTCGTDIYSTYFKPKVFTDEETGEVTAFDAGFSYFMFFSRGLDGKIYKLNWENLALLVKEDKDLYDQLMVRVNEKRDKTRTYEQNVRFALEILFAYDNSFYQ